MEPAVPGRLDAATLPAHAPEHRRRVFYSGSARSSRFFNPSTDTWSAIIATTNYSGVANLRHVRAAALDARRTATVPGDDFRRWQSGDGHDRNHRSLSADAGVAVRAADVVSRGSR